MEEISYIFKNRNNEEGIRKHKLYFFNFFVIEEF